MKALISQAKGRVTPGQVTEDELSRVESLLKSEDWKIASSQHGIAQSSEMHIDTSAVNQQSLHTGEEHPPIDSHLEAEVDLQMEVGMEAFHEEDSPDVVPNESTNESRVEERGNLKLGLKVEMGLETSPLPDILSAVSETTAEIGSGISQDPLQPQTSEAAPVDVEEEEPEEIREMTNSDTVRPDVSELEVSMAELTTPLRSWSFKKTEKKGLELSDFSPVRVVRSKSKGIQQKQPSTCQMSSLANSPDGATPVVTPGSFPPAQEMMSQEVGSIPDAITMLSSSQEITSSNEESQEVPPTVSSPDGAIRSQKVSSASQEEFSKSQEMSSSQEVISSSQEVMSSSQEVAATTSSDVSSLPHSVAESPDSSPHLVASRAQSKQSSTVAVPPHPKEKAAQQKRQERSAEEEVGAVAKHITAPDEARLNEKEILLAEGQLEPGFDALGVQFSTLKQGGTALLSKVKTLAEKGKDRFTSSELGSRMEARLEKPVTKMREILSTLATPPTHEPRPHHEPMKTEPDSQGPGYDTTAVINTAEGKSPIESPVGSAEAVEEIDYSGSKKADIEQLKEITAIVRYE